MAELRLSDLPVMTEVDFTDNDRFVMVDDGKARAMTKLVFQSWLTTNVKGERGEQGVAGNDGRNGTNGKAGLNGENGLSAYQIAVQNGFVGSNSEWLNSLKGAAAAKGEDGDRGWSPVFKTESFEGGSYLKIIDWIGGEGDKPTLLGYVSDSGVVNNIAVANNLKGQKGDKGDTGEKGDNGDKGERGSEGFQGERGLSAYSIAVGNGFEGTEEEWLISLNPSEVSKDPNNIISKKIDGMFALATDPLEMANSIDALPDKNIMTDAQKDKLEALKTSKYLGTFLTSEEIPLEGAEAGNYADVDSGEPDVDTERWIYDADSLKFVKSVSIPASETSESVKEKYESNPDTNAFTDLEKTKLEEITEETSETIKSKYEINPDTNAYTNLEKEKLSSLELETSESIKAKYEGNLDTNAFTDDEKSKLAGLPSEVIPETEESIKEKYESNLDTNVFTDAEKSKLSELTVGSINENGSTPLKFWVGTQEEYDLIVDKDPTTLYVVKDTEVSP